MDQKFQLQFGNKQKTQHQLRQKEGQPQRLQTAAEALKIAKGSIIKFDKFNTENFLDSAETAIEMAEGNASKLTVLKYAKQRVTNSVLIENKQKWKERSRDLS